MKKTEVMATFSAARSACEMVTYLLRSTAFRHANQGERGPDEQRPYLIPLSKVERDHKLMEAYWWARVTAIKASKAQAALASYLEQNDINGDRLQAFGKRKGFIK
jgi:hypothetical protein